MISNRLSSSIIRPKTILQGCAKLPQGTDMVTRFLKSKTVGTICETAADNPVICQSLFSLAICCGARPITNYVTTPDKKDAAYASCHSISSGVMGFVWPFLIATPLAAGVKKVLRKPQMFLKPEVIKKYYPTVGLEEIVQNGKKIKRVMTNAKGKLLRQDGTELWRDIEPLKIKHGDARGKIKDITEKISKTKNQTKIERLNAQKAELEARHKDFLVDKENFEKLNPSLYVDGNGVVRSKDVLKTEKGIFQIDDKGEKAFNGVKDSKFGCVIQKPDNTKKLDKILKGEVPAEARPVTEEMEEGLNKEQNIKNIINWIPDIILAPPRAILTIQLIPWLLGKFGMEKKKKGHKPECCQQQQQNNIQAQNMQPARQSAFAGIQAHIASSTKKGGV